MEVENLFSVKGKTVLITGGAKGIGLMIARAFIANGATVYITGRDAPACKAATLSLGPRSHALPADLRSHSECERLVESLPPRLDVLVNNAGATWGAPLEEHDDKVWERVLSLNLQRAFTLVRLCLSRMERRLDDDGGGPARVIHIGSIDGIRVPALSNFAYAASKAGLHHLSRALARELGPRGVTSNVVACGPFPTRMMRAVLESGGDELAEEVPLRRIGRPDDVGGACLFLASRAGAYCNGALIRLDGGASLVSRI
ncbi:hypothetical protein CDD80_7012 [Ophiocordyceps camponoti-rufipedis]|uniref:Ketoreductase domain-containing protein n=1 Tax=Ophiocordyceps camponoti-rufipedis TaxID=2004952 RepID=A0A2C5YPZ9_9HYPO|nr:hypothetical protein CDD80_7012 [Ophiocordyceps camponoti-rufipedis]